MDFKKLAKSVAKGAVKYAESAAKDMERKRERIDRYKDMYERYSDDEIRKKYKSTSDLDRKQAMIEIMKERGY